MTTFQSLFLFFEFVIVLGVLIYLHSITISLLRGCPYVATKSEMIDSILKKASLQKGSKFLELGCGDGRVVCKAVKEYGVLGRGVDVSRLWLLIGVIRAHHLSISANVHFLHQNILEADVSWADVIYLYSIPKFLSEYQKILKQKLRPGLLIISHVFELEQLREFQKDVVSAGRVDTYFYQIT